MRAPHILLVSCVLLATVCTQASTLQRDGLLQHRRSMLSVLTNSNSAYEFGGLPAPLLLDEDLTVSQMAEQLALSKDDIYTLNPLLNEAEKAQAGFALNVPGRAAVPTLPATLSLQSAEEARAFAQAYGISMEELAKANPKVDFATLDKAHTVHVPAPEGFQAVECPQGFVCVLPAESLTSLSGRLECDVEDILSSNPHVLQQNGQLFANQVLNAPGASAAAVTGSIKMQPGDNIYKLMIETVGVPVSPTYLARLAVANDAATVEDLVAISASEIELDLVDPTASAGVLPGDEQEEQPTQARRRLMSVPSGGHAAAFPFSMGRNLLQYRRRLDEPSEGAPLLTRLHQDGSTKRARAIAETNIERSVMEGDADALLKALQADVNSAGAKRRLSSVDEDEAKVDALLSQMAVAGSKRQAHGAQLLGGN